MPEPPPHFIPVFKHNRDKIVAKNQNLQSHGGDIELVATDDDVKVRLQGGYLGVAMTMRMGIERILKEKVPEVKEVIAVD